jgi:hypothetical protein
VCAYIYIDTYVHIHIHTYIRTYTHTYIIHTYIHAYIHTYIHTYKHTHTHTHTHTPELAILVLISFFSRFACKGRAHAQGSPRRLPPLVSGDVSLPQVSHGTHKISTTSTDPMTLDPADDSNDPESVPFLLGSWSVYLYGSIVERERERESERVLLGTFHNGGSRA